MKKLIAWALKSKKRYSVNRKYALKQFENIDIYVEGLETREEITKELEYFDELAKTYRKKEEDIGDGNIEVEKNNNQNNEIKPKEVPF